RIGFVGGGGVARIEAAEVDLGLIAVGTAQSGELRLRNMGTVPLSFAVVQADERTRGTAAAAAASESKTLALVRDLLLSHYHQQQQQLQQLQDQQQSRQQQQLQQRRRRQRSKEHKRQEQQPEQLQYHGNSERTGNDQALAQVFGAPSAPPPPPPPPPNSSTPIPKDALSKGLLLRRNSEGSVGSADSFSVSRDGCWLGFEPALGDLAPGRSTTIKVTCEGGKLPERFRAAARVMLQSSDARGVSFGSEYISVRAEIQEPTVYITTRNADESNSIDVGTAYLGVPLTRRVKMVNLSNLEAKFRWERPGGPAASFDLELNPSSGVLRGKEVRELELRFTARQSGPVDEVYACRVFGMAVPLGFAISGKSRGPTLTFGLVNEEHPPPTPIQRPQLPQYVGEEPLPEPEPAPPLEFGMVGLRGRKTLKIFVQNLSAIATPFSVKIRKHSCTPCPPKLKISNMSYSALQRVVSNPRALSAYLDDDERNSFRAIGREGAEVDQVQWKAESCSCRSRDGALTSTRRQCIWSNKPNKRGRLCDDVQWYSAAPPDTFKTGYDYDQKYIDRSREKHEATEAFFSEGGRERTKGQIDQREDCFVLKEGLGAAFLAEPASGTLAPWGVATVAVTVFNDTPGRYTDKMDITFRGAPTASLPMKVVVEGSPLSLKREALGLDMSGPEPLLSFGEVFVHGGSTFRFIKV
ncbi:unnamed protein product, partial [Hapterophycus canaliculatus]